MDTDSTQAALDWGARYQSGDTPWDLGGPHPELLHRARSLAPPRPGALAFVPGAGRGHDALYLARLGWRVVAVDLVASLAVEVGPKLAAGGVELRIQDALALGPADLGGAAELVLEHTFLCALNPSERPRWGALMDRILAPAGRIAALVFPVDKPESLGGPPFRLTPQDVSTHLGAPFASILEEPAARPLARRTHAEWWCEFARRA